MYEDYEIVTATEEDRERIAEFVRLYYYSHSPLNVAVNVTADRPTSQIYPLRFLSEGTSLLAVLKSDRRILGVSINGERKPGEENYNIQDLKNASGARVKVAKFICLMEEKSDIWRLTGADRAMYIILVAVDPAFGGRGIGKALMEHSRDKAISKGYPLLRIHCSNHFTAKIARSMGMESVYTQRYSDYKDENGVPVFTPPPPHTEAVTFIQRLNQ